MNEPRGPEVAWKAIEEGAEVFSAEAESVGRVSRVVGDADADVFTGLTIKLSPLGSERFIASERVTGIWPDRVDVDLPRDAVEELGDYEETPAVRWQPESGAYVTYHAVDGSGYVRVAGPVLSGLLEQLPAEQRSGEVEYVEHLVIQFGSVTYFGNRR